MPKKPQTRSDVPDTTAALESEELDAADREFQEARDEMGMDKWAEALLELHSELIDPKKD